MSTPHDHDDRFERRLRAAFQEEAAMVQPSGDGLARIRERTSGASAPWWRQRLVLVGAGAVAAAVVGGTAVGAILGGGDDEQTQVAVEPTPTSEPETSEPAGETSAAGPTPDPEVSPSETSSQQPTGGPSTTAGGGAPATVPVYYVTTPDDGSPRLYREFHEVPSQGAAGLTALTELFGGEPVDPDYESLWPDGTSVTSYVVEGGTATVELDAWPGLGASFEGFAVQQLVYTVTAAEQGAVERVQLLVDGEAPPSGHFDLSEPVERDNPLDVQGLVWILDPTHGASTTSPVQVRVYGTAFEGNVILEFYRLDGGAEELVEQTFVTTAMGEFAEASTEVELEPGEYRVVANDENAEDGELVPRDDKVFTVR